MFDETIYDGFDGTLALASVVVALAQQKLSSKVSFWASLNFGPILHKSVIECVVVFWGVK